MPDFLAYSQAFAQFIGRVGILGIEHRLSGPDVGQNLIAPAILIATFGDDKIHLADQIGGQFRHILLADLKAHIMCSLHQTTDIAQRILAADVKAAVVLIDIHVVGLDGLKPFNGTGGKPFRHQRRNVMRVTNIDEPLVRPILIPLAQNLR